MERGNDMSAVQPSVDCSYLIGRTNADLAPHVQLNRCFPCIVAVYVEKGRYCITAPSGRTAAEAGAGEAVIVPEWALHGIEMPEAGRLTWAHFCCRVGGQDILAGLGGPATVRGEAAEQLRALIAQLNATERQADGVRTQLTRHGLIARMGETLTDALSPSEVMVSEVVRRAMQRIEESFQQPMRLDELSAEAGLSGSALEKRFRAEVHISPLRYQRECRIRRAMELLLQGKRVCEAADLVGYPDPYYFSRIFRESVGLSPAQYQKQYRSAR